MGCCTGLSNLLVENLVMTIGTKYTELFAKKCIFLELFYFFIKFIGIAVLSKRYTRTAVKAQKIKNYFENCDCL